MIDRSTSEYSRTLEAQIKRHTCICGADVVIAWVGGEYHIKCSKCGLDPALKRIKTYTEMARSGEYIPLVILERIEKRRKRNGAK